MSSLAERAAAVLCDTYSRQPVNLVRGEGAWVVSDCAERFLDRVGGVAANVLGHSHPALLAALGQQAYAAIHTGNLHYAEPPFGWRSGVDSIDGQPLSINPRSDGVEDPGRSGLGFWLPVWVAPQELPERVGRLAPQTLVVEPADLAGAVSVPGTGALPAAFPRAILASGVRQLQHRRVAAADRNVVLPPRRCRALVCGPGHAGLDHSPQESISLGDYARAVEVLA